jgi:DNA-binding NarL/FixJ family response regulator
MAKKQLLPSILKIITVDDSPIVAERLKTMLADMGNVRYLGNATNISSALHLINQHRPNVVILDIHLEDDMPAANGMNLLISLRNKYPDMIIIMLTNLAEDQYRNTCIALGADYFFDKSNDFDRIPETIRENQSVN